MRIHPTLGLVLVSTLALAGCAADATTGDEGDLSWDQFQAMTFQEPDTGIYVVNGDEIIEDEQGLRAFYDRLIAEEARLEDGIGTTQQPLIVDRVNGVDNKWSAAQAQNLTYCVSKDSFGVRYTTAVNAINAAVAEWNAVAKIKFVYVPAQDGKCTSNNTKVLFDVRQVCYGQYTARSFFPNASRGARELLVDCSAFGNITPWTLTGVFRHELGHILGFRHEHTRPEAGTCFEDNLWRPLTAYDSASVMHYPQCNGTNTGDLTLTASDKAGAVALYPF